jgi:tRNA pseudouridine55 synthase
MKDFQKGEVILIQKPITWTSFQVVNKLKYIIRSFELRNSASSSEKVDAVSNKTTKEIDVKTNSVEKVANSTGKMFVPIGIMTEPIGEKKNPIGTNIFPIGEESIPIGKTTEPIGTEKNPIGTNIFPIGEESIPIGKTTEPIDTEKNPIGTNIFPIGEESIPIGKTTEPIGEEKNPIGTAILPNRATKNRTPKLKIGHAGTLDPLATGLLIICTGKQTKNIEQYQAQEKEYTGTFYFGATTPCFDLEKEVDFRFPTEHITEEMIEATAKTFVGIQEQVPPIYSAIKIEGKRAYDIARAGKTAEIKPKTIEIKTFEITRIALPEVDFRIVCSKGTYIRSLARDFGLAMNSGAHLTALCRTRIGEFNLENAFTIAKFEASLLRKE